MSDAPEWDDRIHPTKIRHRGNAPAGWSDEHAFAPYVRADRLTALRAALEEIAEQDEVEMMLDPTWAKRAARATLARLEQVLGNKNG